MKFCKNCNKFYPEEAKFCPKCGSVLETPLKTDIFGDIYDERIKNIRQVKDKNIAFDNYAIYNDRDPISKSKSMATIFTILSCVIWLVPFIGSLEIALTLFNNYKLYKLKTVSKVYVILPVVMLLLSIGFIVLVKLYKVI